MVTGVHPDGRKAFYSKNLRGLADYARKHGIKDVQLGTCISGDGLYEVTYCNGVVCRDSFADPSVMLGYFLALRSLHHFHCERSVFNRGSSFGVYRLPFLLDIGRDGSGQVGPWHYKAYRDDTQTPMVAFTR